jgi:outer membrane biosynthesis protein TonB
MKFYQKLWFIILMLFVFAPLGIFLLWKYSAMNKPAKIVLSAIFGLAFIIAVVPNGADTTESNKVASEPAKQTAAAEDNAQKEDKTKKEDKTQKEDDKAKADKKAKEEAEAKAKKEAEEKAIIKISAVDLAEAYEENEVKADKNYKSKTVEVKGKIKEIGVMFGQTFVVLSSGKDFSLTDIQCFFKDESEIDKIADLKKGDTITVTGVVDGKSMNVGINKCKIK